MKKKTAVNPLSAAVGAAFITSLAGAGAASASDNPFAMTELPGGYMVADSHEGKCGGEKKAADPAAGGAETKAMEEGKCGEGKCGAKREAHEGKCGAEKQPPAEGKCGAGN